MVILLYFCFSRCAEPCWRTRSVIDNTVPLRPMERDRHFPRRESAHRALSEVVPPSAHGLRSCATRSRVDVLPGFFPTSLSSFPYLPPQMVTKPNTTPIRPPTNRLDLMRLSKPQAWGHESSRHGQCV